MIYLIVGRTGSGKDYLAYKFCSKYNLKELKSYTTRPKRFEDEDTHIFINPEDSKLYTDRVAETNINGYEYFATKQQVEDCDIYLIDPNGLKYLVKNMPDTNFSIIYVSSLNNMRLNRAISRVNAKSEDLDNVKKTVYERSFSENNQFSLFENHYLNNLKLDVATEIISSVTSYEDLNINKIYLYLNSYSEEYCDEWIDTFYKNVIIKNIENNL